MSARILVVDDILPNVKLLEAKLSSEYYDVITATGGAEALEKISKENPDIVLLDVMMPGMDGFEVCRKIKENPDHAHIPVVMVTALTDTEDKVRGLESGADDFLSKPINDTALMARVRSLVRLKMALDEWRMRENTASQLGVTDETVQVMQQPASEARILVVEDKEFEKKKIADTLAEDKHKIEAKTYGTEAMEAVTNNQYDLIIVSLNLEHEDGLRLCSHLRTNEKTRSVPIVMVAEEDDMKKVASGLEIGAHDYILRPMDKNELRARVRTQIRRKRFQEKLRSSYEVSLSMALTDSLTGLYNRRYLEVHLDKLLQKNHETDKSLAILFLDIDHFKPINDTYGHKVGDEILQQFAKRLVDGLRSFDLIARIGGEEFIAVLPEVSDDRAYRVAERLRLDIGGEPFPCSADDSPLEITCSIGGTIVKPGEREVDSIIRRADQALYQAKDEGRNCVVFEGKGKLDPEEYKTVPRDNPAEDAEAPDEDEGGNSKASG